MKEDGFHVIDVFHGLFFPQELCGRKQTVRALFQSFADMEKTFKESLQRNVVVGLAHNDLHGGNLLVDSQGLVWLIDFATVKEDQHVASL